MPNCGRERRPASLLRGATRAFSYVLTLVQGERIYSDGGGLPCAACAISSGDVLAALAVTPAVSRLMMAGFRAPITSPRIARVNDDRPNLNDCSAVSPSGGAWPFP